MPKEGLLKNSVKKIQHHTPSYHTYQYNHSLGSWSIGRGLKMVRAIRTALINGCKMDMRWFLN